jgi:mannosidase alpha-like ER degradation enhancer 2
VDVSTGKWTAVDFGIGGGVDSYFEYLVKGGIMFNIPELIDMFHGWYNKRKIVFRWILIFVA